LTWADYFLIALTAISCIMGIWRGLVREVISLITWVAAVVLSWEYAGAIEPHLGGVLAEDSVRTWAARAIIFIAVVLIGTAIGALAARFMRASIFSALDRLGGGILGVLRSLVVIGLLVILGHALRLTGEPWWRDSLLRPFSEHTANVLRSMVGERKIEVLIRRSYPVKS
jgi:membrane protein required for colicin V production